LSPEDGGEGAGQENIVPQHELTLSPRSGRERGPALRACVIPLITALLILSGSSASALEIRDVRWGFDGKVVKNRFNLLSVLVDNPKPEAFDGELVLRKSMGNGQPIDAPVHESVYVGPFAQKWVQFYPYFGNDWETFSVHERTSSGRRGPSFDVPNPRKGWPARVLIETSQLRAARGLPVRRLPDNLFPPFVTATDTLQAVLFDAAPNWDEPRRTAFLHWLHLGGTAYVLQISSTEWPQFPAALGMLNSPLDITPYGGGRIIRVARTRSQLSAESLTQVFNALPKRFKIKVDGTSEEQSAVDLDDDADQVQSQQGYSDPDDPLSGSSFLTRLKKMTKPKHNWPLLHILFWMYIGLIFPGCYLIGRKWADYRVVYAALLATVAVFSTLFALVGQRGYGESTAVHSVAIARPLPDGQLDVTQWSNAFVTTGGDYDIRHDATGPIYSTCNTNEAVNGVIRNGAEGQFLADIPPFSSREFAHRMRIAAPSPQLSVESFQVEGDQLRTLSLKITGDLPAQAESFSLLFGNRFYILSRQGDRLELGAGVGTAAGYLRVEQFQDWQYTRYGNFGNDDLPVIDQYRQLFSPLISRSLNVSRQSDALALELPRHAVRVFYVTPMTEPFFARNQYLGKQEGWTLYAIDVPLEESRKAEGGSEK
ncbi:MAG: hypothetical protein SH850_20085, partial [Planctomycetaceae bacterium]|nr:hypothetical protein [Planctomycetaceae bacterium]